MSIHNTASLGNSQIIKHLLFLSMVPDGIWKEVKGRKKGVKKEKTKSDNQITGVKHENRETTYASNIQTAWRIKVQAPILSSSHCFCTSKRETSISY